MDWTAKEQAKQTAKAINVGDQVCYSRQFLQSTGEMLGELPFAQGIVKELQQVGDTTLAKIEWDNPFLPPKVNVANLSVVGKKGIREQN